MSAMPARPWSIILSILGAIVALMLISAIFTDDTTLQTCLMVEPSADQHI